MADKVIRSHVLGQASPRSVAMMILSQARQLRNGTPMGLPVNFDSVSLDGILSDWIGAMREFSVEAVAVLGPDPFGGREDRQVVAVHPPIVAEAAQALAESRDFGARWRESDAPLVAWQYIAKSDHLSSSRWRMLWLAHGFQTVVRVEFTLPAGRAFECFMFSARELTDRAQAASLVWSAMNIWPLVKRSIAAGPLHAQPSRARMPGPGLPGHDGARELACRCNAPSGR